MRTIHKQWKNRRSGFTHRITWYQDPGGGNIRLQVETPDGSKNLYPASQGSAQAEWDQFKGNSPQ